MEYLLDRIGRLSDGRSRVVIGVTGAPGAGKSTLVERLAAGLGERADYAAWRSLLKQAGVRPARLHDARHTAATTLLVLKVPTRAATTPPSAGLDSVTLR